MDNDNASSFSAAASTLHTSRTPNHGKVKQSQKPVTFDLFGLPRELRDVVYKEVIRALPEKYLSGSFNRPGSGTIRKRVPKPGAWGRKMYQRFPKGVVPTEKLRKHGLLYVSKQAHVEYAEVLYKNGVTITLHISPDNIVVDQSHPVVKKPAVSKLKPFWELSPILKSYLTRCQIKLTWNNISRKVLLKHLDDFSKPVGDALKGFSRLQNIEVVLSSPQHCLFRCPAHQNLFREVFNACENMSTVNKFVFKIEIERREDWLAELRGQEGGGWDVDVHDEMRWPSVEDVSYKLAPGEEFKVSIDLCQ